MDSIIAMANAFVNTESFLAETGGDGRPVCGSAPDPGPSPERRELFRLTVDQASEAILLVDAETGAFIDFNEAAHANLGYTREELATLSMTDIWADASPEEVNRHIEKVMQTGGAVIETRQRCKDGTVREVRVSARPIQSNGKPVLGAVIRDITAYKRLESTLGATADFVSRDIGEGFFAALARFAAETFGADYVHVALLEPDPRYVRTLAAWHDGRLLDGGYVYALACTPCENVVNIVHKCYADHVQSLFPQDKDLEILGAKSYVEEPILDGEGHAVGLIVLVARHVMEYSEAVASAMRILASRATAELVRRRAEAHRKLAEQALRESEAQFRLLLDSTAEAIYGVNTQGICTFVNRACLRMLGYEREEDLIGRGIHALIHHTYPDGRPYPKEECRVRLSTVNGDSTYGDDEVHWRADGTSFPVEFRSHPMYRDGQLVGAVVTFVDITERKRAEEALRRSEERYRYISSVTTDLLYSCGRHEEQPFVVDWITGSVEPIFGCTADDILARRCWRCFVHPEDLPVFDRNVIGLGPGRSSECELRVIREDGAVRYLRAYSKMAATDEMGNGHRLYGACQDITEKKLAAKALHESESLLRTVIDESPQIILMQDWAGRFLLANRAWAQLHGTTIDALAGTDDGAFRNCEQVECLGDNLQSIMRSGETQALIEKYTDAATGEARYYQSIKKPLKGPNGEARILVIATDITDLRRAQSKVEESERRLEYALSATGEGIWDWDLSTGRVMHNAQWCRLLGFDEPFMEHPQHDLESLLHEDDREAVMQAMWRCLRGDGPYQSRHRMHRRDGGVIWVLDRGDVVERNGRGRPLRMVGSLTDITEQQESLRRIEFLAHHDALTSLPNRVLARDRFEYAVSQTPRAKSKVALLFLDMDHFKTINDTLGHEVGDHLLQQVASRLAASVRSGDTISRQGGDEFLIVLAGISDETGADAVARNILASLSQPVQVDSHLLHTSFSIGISVYPDDGHDFDTLLKKADTAMYSAKEAGRNTHRFFTEEMNVQAFERLQIQNRLRNALAASELTLHYQPQVELAGGRVTGVEALLRWQNSDLGPVAPSRFIPVAEESGLILPIGAWVLREACRQAQRWRECTGRAVTIAVNLSALQFRRGDLVETVSEAIRESGLAPALLELELTESILLQDVDTVLATISRLKSLGVGLAIDDFGTGYSSLSYLKRFAVSRLKIDQSFVRDMIRDPDDGAIVKAIIQMARSLKLDVIAEGVEEPEQAEWLQREGCRQAQGYLFGRPMSPKDIESLLIQGAATPAIGIDL